LGYRYDGQAGHVFPGAGRYAQIEYDQYGSRFGRVCNIGCYAVSSIIFGYVSDRLGARKKLLIPFLLGTAIFAAAGVLVNSFSQLLLVRALIGSVKDRFPLSLFYLVQC
jgi:nitrate/nitrite transporter NarK